VKLLLDTHALLCLSQSVSLLGRGSRELLGGGEAQVFLSLCSIWELAIKLKLGKLQLDVPLEEAVDAGIDAGLRLLNLRPEAIYRTLSLDLAHRDPFDRILAAQALVEDMAFVSRDAAFDLWGVRRIW
jgi:PIN domain nuclease of toxin-antitoxin system